jgi:hypothetical protein
MGLFGRKKDGCPVCGGEVKGLFNKKIADKQVLCKDCSAQVSMQKELLKQATPEFIQEHLEYRQKNALKFNALRWDMKFEARGTEMGVDPGAGFLYIRDSDMDDEDNPVVFSFDQITRYELYRLNKCVDSSDTPGDVVLESTLSFLSGVAKILDQEKRSQDYFRLVVTTTEPYWPEIELKIHFDSPDDIYGFAGFGEDLKKMCKVMKSAVRKEPVVLF